MVNTIRYIHIITKRIRMKFIKLAFVALATTNLAFAMEEPTKPTATEEKKEYSVKDLLAKYPNAEFTLFSITSLAHKDDSQDPVLTSVEGIKTLDYYPNIHHFDFSKNAIELKGTPFAGERSTCRIVTLNSNQIPALWPLFFEGLNKLHKLELVNNNIEELPKNWGPLARLRVLNLRKNKLTKIFAGSFADLKKLLILNLSENQLEEFALAENEMPKLTLLDLSGNHLDAYRKGQCTISINANLPKELEEKLRALEA